MDKKRQYVLVIVVLFSTTVFSQHPHSRGGNPLYWALVGAGGALINYLIYLGLSNLIAYIKGKKKKGKDTCVEAQTDDWEIRTMEPIEKKETNEIQSRFCRTCGKEIDYESVKYCKYCGKPID